MATITIKNLVKKYGDTIVVNNVNLSVNDGEFITLLGPSGCGKTTTLRAIAGLVEIDDGEIYLDDRLINDLLLRQHNHFLFYCFLASSVVTGALNEQTPCLLTTE